MQEQKTAPQERGAGANDLTTLFDRFGFTQEMIAASLGVQTETVEIWCKGMDVPESSQCVALARILGCSLKKVYLAIICTPMSQI